MADYIIQMSIPEAFDKIYEIMRLAGSDRNRWNSVLQNQAEATQIFETSWSEYHYLAQDERAEYRIRLETRLQQDMHDETLLSILMSGNGYDLERAEQCAHNTEDMLVIKLNAVPFNEARLSGVPQGHEANWYTFVIRATRFEETGTRADRDKLVQHLRSNPLLKNAVLSVPAAVEPPLADVLKEVYSGH